MTGNVTDLVNVLIKMFRFVINAVCTVASVSAFIVFLIYGNYQAAVWASVAAALSAIDTHLHWLKLRKVLNQWYEANELNPIHYIGLICFTLGLMGIGYHSTIQIMLKKPMLPINQSQVIAIVWAFVTARGGLSLMCTVRTLTRHKDDEEPFIVEEGTNDNLHTVE